MLLAVAPEEVLYGYGPLGVGVVVLAYFGYKLFNIILSDRDKAIKDRDALLEDVFTKVLPAIARNTDVLERRQELDRDLVGVIKESNSLLAGNAKALDEVKFMITHARGGPHVGGDRGAL